MTATADCCQVRSRSDGAACYVPMKTVSSRLLPTYRSVLGVCAAARFPTQLQIKTRRPRLAVYAAQLDPEMAQDLRERVQTTLGDLKRVETGR